VEQQERVTEGRRFGRYLRRIREERKLSLDAVQEMSLGYRERVTKSHLSRIESGQAVPSFPRMFTLSQIYGVPVTSLAERFELELLREQTHVEVVDWSDEALLVLAEELKQAGKYSELVQLTAAVRERPEPISPVAARHLDIYRIDALLHLERYESAKLESEVFLGASDTTTELRIRGLLCLAIASYRLKRHTIASMALSAAENDLGDGTEFRSLAARLISLRAAILHGTGHFDAAAPAFDKAIVAHVEAQDMFEACRARINLGETLMRLGRHGVARRHLEAGLREADGSGYDRLRCYALSNLGALSYHEGHLDAAEGHLLRSNVIARPREYLTLLFQSCYYLWRIAIEKGDKAAERANEQTLRSYLGRVEADLDEAARFRVHLAGGRHA